MLSKYLIENQSFKTAVIIGYSEDGVLVYYDATAIDNKASQIRFLSQLPTQEVQIASFKKEFPMLKISKAQTDLSFNALWNAYGYKVGKKAKAEAKWLKLSEAEMVAVFKCLPKYNEFLQTKGHARAYLETFLNNQYWENEFK